MVRTLTIMMSSHIRNLQQTVRLRQNDNAGLQEPAHSTQYSGATAYAVRDIAACSELTIDYGDYHYKPGKPTLRQSVL
jgi:hypothetical protein